MADEMTDLTGYELDLATAILGVDTLWGGNVSSPSGLDRFIADCYFSGTRYPVAFTHPLAVALRASGGLSAPQPDVAGARAYLAHFDLPAALDRVRSQARAFHTLRRRFVEGLVGSLEVMLELARETMGEGAPVAYERCVQASTGHAPALVDPEPLRAEIAALLTTQGEPPDSGPDGLLGAVDRWRNRWRMDRSAILGVGDTILPELEELTEAHVLPHLPARLRNVPRSNVTFVPLENAWFSGSMNYLGRNRTPDGEPEYEATYEINIGLEISEPEFRCLVAHEVVPGHVMTFALLQYLHHIGRLGFEATILTMNSRASTLYEGLANAAILLAHGVTSARELPDERLQLGTRLARLQDVAKNNASYLTWAQGLSRTEVAHQLRTSCLVSPERADKLSGSWARHPILGRMYLPSYESGTRLVLELLANHGPARLFPVLYGAFGLVDCQTITDVLKNSSAV